MKKNFSLFGLFFGILLANKSNASLLYLFIFAMIFIALFCVEKWGLQKMVEKEKLMGLANSLIFLIVTLATALLYVGFLSEAFLKVLLISTIIALVFIYLPDHLKIKRQKALVNETHVTVNDV